MRPAWRLATNNLSGRLSRTVMLVIAVAMSAGLIAAVACVMASLTLAVEQRIKSTVGSAELRLRHVGSGSFDAGVLEQVRGWPEVASVTGRVREALALRRPTDPEGETNAVTCWGVDPATERDFRPATLVEGRYVQGPGEVVLDEAARRSVKAGVGERLIVERFGDPVELTVVGIVKPPPLGAIVEREECFMALAAMPAITGEQGRVTEADIQLRPQQNPESVAAARRGEGSLPPGVILQLTERVTSGLNKNMESNEVGFYLACVLSFMAAAFIITTGMTTSVTERTRELAILRSIGAERRQLAWAQMLVGLLVGSVGAAIGVPGGVGAAYLLVWLFPEQLPGGFAMSQGGVALAMVGAVLSGVFGAAWPAVAASRVSPLEGLSLRARPPAAVWVWVCLGAGCVLVAAQYLLMTTTNNRNLIFWGYVTAGLPMMMVGYFLLAVPVNRVVTALLSAPLSRALGLPRSMLARTVAATPFRHGFTAASMMLGLALMLSIWTNGRAIMNDWLESLALPDAFIYGHNLKADAVERVRKNVPEVLTTCAITVQNVDTDWAGGTGERQVRSPTTGGTLRGLGKYKTSFVGFEPEAFFSMTRLSWEAGTKEEAVRRLNAGGAVIVSREFAITHGFRLGDRVRVTLESKGHDFEVVGIVSSPGLDIVSKFLEVGEQYVDQSINAICGSREDLRTKFGNDAVSFLQMEFAPGTDGKAVLRKARQAVGAGVLVSVTAVEMKARIREFIGGGLFVLSVVSVGAMLVACLSVANLIVASIHARQFEFGVLRAVGAERWLLARLVFAEAALIGVTACIVGTAMGMQGAWAGQQVHRVTVGLVLQMSWPWSAVLAGWGTVLVITLAAAWPAVQRLLKRHPRELLAAVRG